MKLTDEQIEMMKEDMSSELVELLMKNWNCSMEEAMDTLYNSDAFDRLQDKNTGLYYQSPGYIYNYLQQELATGNYRA